VSMGFQQLLDQREISRQALDRLCAKQHKAGYQNGAASGAQTPANLRAIAQWHAYWFWFDMIADYRLGHRATLAA